MSSGYDYCTVSYVFYTRCKKCLNSPAPAKQISRCFIRLPEVRMLKGSVKNNLAFLHPNFVHCCLYVVLHIVMSRIPLFSILRPSPYVFILKLCKKYNTIYVIYFSISHIFYELA